MLLGDQLGTAVATMLQLDAPWAIAGGWALDVHLDRQTRHHTDVDIAILRGDQGRLWSDLHPRSAEYVDDGVVHPWHRDAWLALPTHEVYVTTPDGSRLEILLNEHDPIAGDWVYRRDPRVRRPLSRSFCRTQQVSYLAPEIVLLYKSKSPRSCDEADFAAALPALDSEPREWLRTALETTQPGHAWAAIIARRT